MKKSLLALAVLGAYAGVASAQSSVQLFGTIDVGAKYLKNSGRSRQLSESTDGINSSELRFQGIEDLGGGLKAGFNIRSGFNPDTGTSNAKFWNRQSTVSLYSGAGELRLGRDYVPTFWNQAVFDPFGFNGIGSTGNVARYVQVRQDNAIGYFLPSNIGGWYGQLMVAAAENGTTLDKAGRYIGGRIGFAAGPFNIGFAASEVRFAAAQAANAGTGVTAIPVGQKAKTYNVGGSWDFGFLKLMGYYDHERLFNAKESRGEIGAVIPFGQSEFRVGYDRSKFKPNVGTTTTLDNIKATYQYNLSKRTAMYGTVARLSNKDGTIVSLPGAFSGFTPTAGGSSKGAEVGVRHLF
ncbi:MAG: porin [Caldimonas sp.]